MPGQNSASIQAISFAEVSFLKMADLVKRAFPTASPDAQIAAAAKLAEISAYGYRTTMFGGEIDDSPLQIALEGVRLIPDALQEIAKAMESQP